MPVSDPAGFFGSIWLLRPESSSTSANQRQAAARVRGRSSGSPGSTTDSYASRRQRIAHRCGDPLTLKAHDPADSATTFAELGRIFAELGRIKLGETDLNGVLDQVADLARRTLPGARQVSITMIRGGAAYTAAHTDDAVLMLDEHQYARAGGPCLDAAHGKTTIAVLDAANDDRWDGWARLAADAGFGSVLSVGLPIVETMAGALNLYGERPHGFDPDAVTLAQTFVRYAAVALANAHLYDSTASLAQHMQAAMESRAVIEQAKGIIMGERRCSADEAFAILTKVSQDSNRKLRDVAAALVERTQRPT
jgi:GAF domain-containing protein